MTGLSSASVLGIVWSIILLIVDSIRLGLSNLLPVSLKRKKDIRHEIVLITGGGSGFGQLLAVKFAQLGGRVVIWDVDEEGCLETIRKVEREVSGAHGVHYYVLDVSDRAKVYETAKRVKMDVGEVTILVNNAGIAHSEYFLDTSDSLLEKVMRVNAMAHFWTLKAFLPSMVENNHGHLVTVASTSGLMAAQRASAYSASKHAAIGFLDSVTFDLIERGKTNVKTTLVCPYFSNTPLFQTEYDGLLPMQEARVVVEKIVEGVLTNKQMVYVPHSACFSVLLKTLATKESVYRLCKCLVGESLLKTIRIRSVFEEQISDSLKRE